MSNLATVNSSKLTTQAQWDTEELQILKEQIAKDCSNAELKLFGQVCQRTGLDPFARQIYAIKRGGKMTIQTSIDGYRSMADRSRSYAGSEDPKYDEGITQFECIQLERKKPVIATVTVYKIVQGVRCPFTASAAWTEYSVSNNPIWGKMPYLMLAKCAEALALRKAFPAELSGVYTKEEMGQADNDAIDAPILESLPTQDNRRPLLDGIKTNLDRLNLSNDWSKQFVKEQYEKSSAKELSEGELTDYLAYLQKLEPAPQEVEATLDIENPYAD